MDRKLSRPVPCHRTPRLRIVLEAMESRCPVSSMALSALALPAVAAPGRFSVGDRPGPPPAEIRPSRPSPPPAVPSFEASGFQGRPAPVSVERSDPATASVPVGRVAEVTRVTREHGGSMAAPGRSTALGSLRPFAPGRGRWGRGIRDPR